MTKSDTKRGGRLTTQEKYVIQGMQHSGKTVEEIAAFTNRSQSCIENYLGGELDRIHGQVVKNQMSETVEVESSQPTPNPPNYIPKLTARDLIISKTENGKKTVAIMTEAASMRGDEAKKSMAGRANRAFAGNVVRLSDGKTVEHGESISEKNDGELSKGEINVVVEMLKKNKSVQQIALSLNREENDIARVVNKLV